MKFKMICMLLLTVPDGLTAFSPHSLIGQRRALKPAFMEQEINGTNGEFVSQNGAHKDVCQESIDQYEEVMEHFMFELGNDMVFLEGTPETSNFIQNRFDVILFDCEGVLYKEKSAIPSVSNSIQSLMQSEKKVYFVKSNDGVTADNLAKILNFSSFTEEQIIASVVDLESDPSRTLLVTDRMDTSMPLAKKEGMISALVLTGMTSAEDVIEVSAGVDDLPQIIFPHVGLIQL
mmetsp:Transcript_6356/g.9306  ORF Transcript_6356/g.9306 Transcript_6356/m.9306 type:complete len:233 (-) Transcript_6356:34-732(-)